MLVLENGGGSAASDENVTVPFYSQVKHGVDHVSRNFPSSRQRSIRGQPGPKSPFVRSASTRTTTWSSSSWRRNENVFRVARNREVSDNYGVSVLPTIVLIGREGRIQYRHVGFDSEVDLIRKLSDEIEILLRENVS